MLRLLVLFLAITSLGSCSSSRHNAAKKYSAPSLQQDYQVFRKTFEQQHPGLWWYTSKDSMDAAFSAGYNSIKDSLTEPQFQMLVSKAVSKIGCGHTVVRSSKAAARKRNAIQFPLVMKLWPDTAVAVYNVSGKGPEIKRGTIINSIDGKPIKWITDSMFKLLSTDGYNQTHKYQTLSNGFSFGRMYMNLFGVRQAYRITYTDSLGNQHTVSLPLLGSVTDSTKREDAPKQKQKRTSRRERLKNMRNLRVDSTGRTAFMDLQTFQKKYRLPRFFRQSFRILKEKEIKNLVIDLRSNGGGSVSNSTLITRYTIKKPFTIIDSLYAVNRSWRGRGYQTERLNNWLFLQLMTHKGRDGNFHLRYFERKRFKPKRRNHFDGQIYLLTGGNSFSATTLFAGELKGQNNVTLVGEETGGGAYGNNAWLLPDLVLPNTKLRIKLPQLRLVINKNAQKGTGVQPDVLVPPSTQAIKEGKDYKMEVVKQLILQRNPVSAPISH